MVVDHLSLSFFGQLALILGGKTLAMMRECGHRRSANEMMRLLLSTHKTDDGMMMTDFSVHPDYSQRDHGSHMFITLVWMIMKVQCFVLCVFNTIKLLDVNP